MWSVDANSKKNGFEINFESNHYAGKSASSRKVEENCNSVR